MDRLCGSLSLEDGKILRSFRLFVFFESHWHEFSAEEMRSQWLFSECIFNKTVNTECFSFHLGSQVSCHGINSVDDFLYTFNAFCRLGSYLFLRILKDGEDRRFRTIKQSMPKFFVAWTLQGNFCAKMRHQP